MSRPAVLVTGAARRIGATIARAFADANWHVVIHYGRSGDAADALAATLPSAETMGCDLANARASEAMVVDLATRLPDWRVIVNCASVFRLDTVESLDADVFDEAMRVNAAAPARLAQLFLRLANARGGRRVIQVTDQKIANPTPDFFFKPGGGPILDLGPYYISNLVQLIGPVVRVAAMSSIPSPERKITSEPRHGEMIKVETPTTIHAVLEFANGAVVTLGASWDVKTHGHRPMELYGTEASLVVPDPNFFGGKVELIGQGGEARDLPEWDHALGVPNQQHNQGMMANYRTAGLADMALAILENRPHRCSLEFALHVVDVMTAILRSGETGAFIRPTTSCEQPAPLGIDEAAALLNKKDT